MRADTTRYTVRIIVEQEPGADSFTAYAPRLRGCFQRGKTVDEAVQAVRRVVRERLRALVAAGKPVSTSETFLRVEELSIDVDGAD